MRVCAKVRNERWTIKGWIVQYHDMANPSRTGEYGALQVGVSGTSLIQCYDGLAASLLLGFVEHNRNAVPKHPDKIN